MLLLVYVSDYCSAQADTLFGDLDADGTVEMVVVNPNNVTGKNADTLLIVKAYRKENGRWNEWVNCKGPALVSTEEVGMERLYVNVELGALVVGHSHVGYNYVDYTHRFRWQNNRFELIGATVIQGERFWKSETFDYNLSTGKYVYREKFYSDDDEVEGKSSSIEGKHHLSMPLLMEDFVIGEQIIKLSNGKVVAF